MQYHTRRAFAPVLVDAIRQGDKLRFYVLSDRLQTEKVTLHLALTDFQGKVIRRHRVEGMLPVNASEVFFEQDWQKAFEGWDTTASFIRMTLKGADGREVLSDEVFYPVHPKEQRLPRAEISCRKVKKGRGGGTDAEVACAGARRVRGGALAGGAFLRQFLRPAAGRDEANHGVFGRRYAAGGRFRGDSPAWPM